MSREAAMARANEAEAQRAAAETARREGQYQSLTLRLQQTRLLPHTSGWSERAWDLVREAAAIRPDAPLRDQAAATLAGVDSRLARELETVGASSLAFDREGKRLLLGGLEPDENRDGRASILDLTGDRPPVTCGLPGPGPVLFRDDGTPLQLTAGPEGGLVLWDLDRRRELARLDVPGGATTSCLALRPDGSSAAASVSSTDGQDRVLVWDVDQRRIRHQLRGKTTALAFSDDGELLAGGDEDGRIRVWRLSSGQLLCERIQGRNTIHCFGFARNPRRNADGSRGWLLAAGDSGGSIVVWDLATQLPISRCNGSAFDVYALAFSPDGMTLASTGRTDDATILWDWATARAMLRCPPGLSRFSSLAFSRDGRWLATGHQFLHEPAYSRVLISELNPGRGIQTLRGLTAPVESVLFSPDGRKIAVLSHDWQIAVWDPAAGRLEGVLNGPKGFTADNAGLAFDGAGRRLAACSGREAKLWDLASGKELRSWTLPPGLIDRVAFLSSGALLAFRCETLDGVHVPIGNDFKVYPRVVRLRNLSGSDPVEPAVESREFNRTVHGVLPILDGRAFVVIGSRDTNDHRYRALKVLDSRTAEELWSLQSPSDDIPVRIEPADSKENVIVVIGDGDEARSSLRDGLTGEERRSLAGWPGKPSPDQRYMARFLTDPLLISHHGDERLLVNLGIDQGVSSANPVAFSPESRCLAWGNPDGSVMVADLEAVRASLTQVRLGWAVPASSSAAVHGRDTREK